MKKLTNFFKRKQTNDEPKRVVYLNKTPVGKVKFCTNLIRYKISQ